jgi:hypothetical protein
MSRWTHPICDRCYGVKEPGRQPVRVVDVAPEPCCWCGAATSIYYRYDPNAAPCGGRHGESHEPR